MIFDNLTSCLIILVAAIAITKADEECTPQIKKTSEFPFEISPADPSHDYDPVLDITTFYFKASRDLKSDEYFFISDDGCDYLNIVNGSYFSSYENYVDELHCTKGRKIWPVEGSKSDFEIYLKGEIPRAELTMAYSVTSSGYSRQAIRGPNCWCRGGKGVLCEPITETECYKKDINYTESCKTWGGHELNGVYNVYPLTGCRTAHGLTEKWSDINYSCGYAHRCPKYGLDNPTPGYFSFCCRTDGCNYKRATKNGLNNIHPTDLTSLAMLSLFLVINLLFFT